MKKLWIIRHAKSSWSDYSLTDHERPLNSRGKRDAPHMADVIRDRYDKPQLLVTSTAKRARQTCKAFRKSLDIPKEEVVRLDELYHASIGTCLKVIHSIDEDVNVAAIFGHNPTFTYLINELTGDGPDNLPTCGCALITTDADFWATFETGHCELNVYTFPKQFFPHE